MLSCASASRKNEGGERRRGRGEDVVWGRKRFVRFPGIWVFTLVEHGILDGGECVPLLPPLLPLHHPQNVLG